MEKGRTNRPSGSQSHSAVALMAKTQRGATAKSNVLTFEEKKQDTQLDGKIEWFDDRFYKRLLPKGFEWYISATTVNGIVEKPFLKRWYGDLGTELAQKRSQEAKDAGTLVHALINGLLNNAEIDGSKFPQEIWRQVVHFSEWYESVKPVILGSEIEVFSDEWKCAGTLDLVYFMRAGEYDLGMSKPVKCEAGVRILDIKTGKEDWVYGHQTAAYAKMLMEMKRSGLWRSSIDFDRIEGTDILFTKTQTKSRWKVASRTREEMSQDLNCFVHELALIRARNLEKPAVFEMTGKIQLKQYDIEGKEVKK
jgi:hypothetical protein